MVYVLQLIMDSSIGCIFGKIHLNIETNFSGSPSDELKPLKYLMVKVGVRIKRKLI